MELFRLFGSIIIDDKDAIKALKNNETQAQNAQTGFDKMADAGLKIGETVVKGLAVAGAAIGGLVVKGAKSADDLTKAINGVEAATGLADSATTGFRDSMISLYNQNFGDSFDDIGKAMAEINQQTGLAGKSLEDTTKNALILRDTFGFEVNESIRSAKMLMEQFGISSEDAYNLIAQGAQWGLNKNGDLLDTINEYSTQFEQMGFTSEEMFNMLNNGAINGTFSVDKLGDAVKEFGIRTKDGSQTSKDAFTALGLNADEMTAKFGEGGAKGKEAFQQVTDALFAMQDPVAQNQVGVALFGTQWEDLGAKGVQALTQVDGEISSTINSLDGINSVKYDSVGEAISGIGRKFETGVLIPVGEKVLPKLQEFADKIDQNMPQIQEKVNQAMVVAGDLFDKFANAIVWASENMNIIIPIVTAFAGVMATLSVIGFISQLMAAWTTITTVWAAITTAATAVGGAFGAVLAFITSPIGLVVLAIAGLIAIGVLLYQNWDTVKQVAISAFQAVLDFVGGAVEKIKGFFNGIIDFVQNNWQGLLLFIVNPFAGAFKLLYDNCDGFRNKVNEIFEGVKNIISGAVEKIKGLFNFNFELPKIKLPHFGVKPEGWEIGDLLKGSVPRLDIDWYANGGIFDKPTLFNTPYGLKGVGEAGPEVVAPLSDLRQMLGQDKNSQDINLSISLNIAEFNNNSDMDIETLSDELAFLTKRKLEGGGGLVPSEV